MRAVVWLEPGDIRLDTILDPSIPSFDRREPGRTKVATRTTRLITVTLRGPSQSRRKS